MSKRAIISGITGQDGSYLAELLLEKGYEVHGIVRRVALEDHENRLQRLAGIRDRVILHAGSLESFPSLHQIVRRVLPDECYHLAAQSFVSYSFDDEFSTLNSNINGTHFILAAIKDAAPACRFYFAGSSEMFGKVAEIPQVETTRFHPRSAYGISKVAGFELTPPTVTITVRPFCHRCDPSAHCLSCDCTFPPWRRVGVLLSCDEADDFLWGDHGAVFAAGTSAFRAGDARAGGRDVCRG